MSDVSVDKQMNMGNVKNLDDEFHTIFNSAQLSAGSHQKLALKLKTLFNLVDQEVFFRTFKKFVKAVLIVDCKLKGPYVERVMEFIGLACYTLKKNFDTTLENDPDEDNEIVEHPFLQRLFSYLLEVQNVADFSIRNRASQLINKVLDHLVDTDLSTQFCDDIEEATIERLNDPKLEIRLEGILALHRFQEIENPLDRIIDAFKVLIEHDRFAKVRCLCVSKIALRKDVIPLIICKLRDVDVAVRLAAFTRLTKIARLLKIEQRRLVLLSASLDTAKKIQSYVESTLLPSWLQHFHNNFHTFMKAVRLDANESDVKGTNTLCEFVLNSLFQTKPLDLLTEDIGINEYKLIPYENLNWETANYWRILVQYIKLANMEDQLEDVLPELVHFCSYIERTKPLDLLTEDIGINEYKLIPYENLNWETANYWRILVQYIKLANMEDQLEDVLPELVHFCSYIERFCNNLPEVKSTTDFLENQFILKQFFTITRVYDVSDPSGRDALLHLMHYVLSDVVLTLDTVETIIKNLEVIIPKVELRARYINELISEVLYPEIEEENVKMQIEFQNRLDTFKNDLATTMRMQESAIAEKDYLLAETLEKRLNDINSLVENLSKEKDYNLSQIPKKINDRATLIKCLDIAAGLLLSPKVTKMTSSLETLKRDTICELMIHENETVQAKAMHCYALLCIIDKKTANDGIHLFYAPISAYQEGQECDIQILLVCIGALVDLLRVFGTQLIAAPEERTDLSESQREDHQRHFFGGTSLTNIIKGLVDLMDDEQIQVQETAGRGLCSLVLNNIVQSSSLLSRLVLKWCNPYDESQKLKQIIGVTLQQLPHIPGFHRQWEGTILITLKALIYAPDDSPYADTNIDDIAKFLIALLGVNLEKESILFDFAMKVCLEIRKKPRAKQVPTLMKILNMLNLNTEDLIIDDLLAICDELRDAIHSSSTVIQMTKFISKLNQIKKHELPTSSKLDSDESEEECEKMQFDGVQTIKEEEEDCI